MHLVVFGLTISSSWGNGHATLWRALCRALARAGHTVTFLERDVPYYAAHRDLCEVPGGTLVLYPEWTDVRERAARIVADADAAIVTSYCPDAREATRLVLESPCPVRAYYDLDTPVTLAALDDGRAVPYLPDDGLGGYDLVLSYTGGPALRALRERLGARRAAPLYGSVDPGTHRPAAPAAQYRADLSYLGTYAEDRQAALEALLVEPARRAPGRRFLIGGAQYPADFPWTPNIHFVRHLPPVEHPAFFSSSPMTLNVTRAAMARMGWCPSGRLFEAAACGTAIVSDAWDGLDAFYAPGEEILVVRDTADVLAALERPAAEVARIAARARERTLDCHTADHRARELVALLGSAHDTAHAAHAVHTAPGVALEA